MTDDIFKLVTRTPGVSGGEPCLAGTRIRMAHFEDLMRMGWSHEKILSEYPHLDPVKYREAIELWLGFRNYWSGTCLCGHSWERHHLSIVARKEYTDLLNEGTVPGECLAYGHNERGGLGRDDEVHCMGFVDKDHPDLAKRARWSGTKV